MELIIGVIAYAVLTAAMAMSFSMYGMSMRYEIENPHFLIYCEQFSTSIPIQKVNAWSSLSFSFFGFLTLCKGPVHWITLLPYGKSSRIVTNAKENVAIQYSFAIIMLLLGYGSFAFHAFFTSATSFLDYAGMNGIISFLLTFTILRVLKEPDPRTKFLKTFLILYLVSFSLRLAMEFWKGYDTTTIQTGFLLIFFFFESILNVIVYFKKWEMNRNAKDVENSPTDESSEKAASMDTKTQDLPFLFPQKDAFWLVPLVLFTSVAAILWYFDGKICDPNSYIQMHAIWHVLLSFSCLFSYLYVVS